MCFQEKFLHVSGKHIYVIKKVTSSNLKPVINENVLSGKTLNIMLSMNVFGRNEITPCIEMYLQIFPLLV